MRPQERKLRRLAANRCLRVSWRLQRVALRLDPPPVVLVVRLPQYEQLVGEVARWN